MHQLVASTTKPQYLELLGAEESLISKAYIVKQIAIGFQLFLFYLSAKLISNTEALPLVFKWPEVIAPPVTPQSLKAKTASTARCNLSHCKCQAGFQFDNRAKFCRGNGTFHVMVLYLLWSGIKFHS